MQRSFGRTLATTVLIGVAFVAAIAAKQKPQQGAPMDFLKKVRDLADIRAAGSLPFHLRASINASPLNRGAFGDAAFIAFSPARSHRLGLV